MGWTEEHLSLPGKAHKLARRPEGGSLVILTPFCKTCGAKGPENERPKHNQSEPQTQLFCCPKIGPPYLAQINSNPPVCLSVAQMIQVSQPAKFLLRE